VAVSVKNSLLGTHLNSNMAICVTLPFPLAPCEIENSRKLGPLAAVSCRIYVTRDHEFGSILSVSF